MKKLVRGEFVKAWSFRTNFILMALLIMVNLICAVSVEKQDMGSWRTNAENLYMEYSEAWEQCIEEEIDEAYYQPFVEKTALIEYALDKNIPYGVTSVFTHILRMMGLMGLFIVIVVYLGGKIYFNEYDARTWKNLFSTGVNKKRIYMSKLVFTICYVILYMAMFLLISIILGLIYFGIEAGGISLSYVDGQVMENSIYIEIFVSYGIATVKLLFYVLVVHGCMIVSQNKMISFMGSVLIMMIVPWINMVPDINKVMKFLPFYYLNMSFEADGLKLLAYFCLMAGYIIALIAISYFKFIKSENDT